MPVPALQRDARNPARALANRSLYRSREILARGDDALRTFGQRPEDLPVAHLVNMDADLIIFSQTSGIENQIVPFPGESLQYSSREPCAHAVRRNEGAAQLPRPHVDRLVLCKLVAIDAVSDL